MSVLLFRVRDTWTIDTRIPHGWPDWAFVACHGHVLIGDLRCHRTLLIYAASGLESLRSVPVADPANVIAPDTVLANVLAFGTFRVLRSGSQQIWWDRGDIPVRTLPLWRDPVAEVIQHAVASHRLPYAPHSRRW